MVEATMTTQFGNQWRENVSEAWYKIPDPNSFEIKRGSDKRPFDVVGCYDGVGFAIEFKMHRYATRAFPMVRVEPHQEYYLKQWKNANGLAFLAIGIWQPPVKEILFVDIKDWLKLKEASVALSIPVADLRRVTTCLCERLDQPARWDIDPFRHTIINRSENH